METTITIRSIERKISQKTQKDWWPIESNQNVKYSCHEKAIADQLEVGETYVLDVVESNGYNNIRAFIGKSNDTPTAIQPSEVKPEPKVDGIAEAVRIRTARELLALAIEHKLSIDAVVDMYKNVLGLI